MMVSPDVVGYAAGFVNMFHLIPQLLKSRRTKSTHDLSLNYTLVHVVGLSIWVLYGFMIMSYPVIIMLSIETLFAVYLVVLKLRNG